MANLVIKESALKSISKVFTKFNKILQDSCMEYAIFRGELYCVMNSDCVFLDLLCSDEDGKLFRKTIIYNPDGKTDEEKFIWEGIVFTDREKVNKAFYQFIEFVVDKLPPINRLFFEFGDGFVMSKIYESKREKNAYVMYFICPSIRDHTYCLSDSSVDGIITQDWKRVTGSEF